MDCFGFEMHITVMNVRYSVIVSQIFVNVKSK